VASRLAPCEYDPLPESEAFALFDDEAEVESEASELFDDEAVVDKEAFLVELKSSEASLVEVWLMSSELVLL